MQDRRNLIGQLCKNTCGEGEICIAQFMAMGIPRKPVFFFFFLHARACRQDRDNWNTFEELVACCQTACGRLPGKKQKRRPPLITSSGSQGGVTVIWGNIFMQECLLGWSVPFTQHHHTYGDNQCLFWTERVASQYASRVKIWSSQEWHQAHAKERNLNPHVSRSCGQ